MALEQMEAVESVSFNLGDDLDVSTGKVDLNEAESRMTMEGIKNEFKLPDGGDMPSSVEKTNGHLLTLQGQNSTGDKAIDAAVKKLLDNGFKLEGDNYIAITDDIIYDADGKGINSGSIRKMVIPANAITAIENKDTGGFDALFSGYVGLGTVDLEAGETVPNASEVVTINDFVN